MKVELEQFVPDVGSTEMPKKNNRLHLLFLLLPVDGSDKRRVEVRFVASSRQNVYLNLLSCFKF